MDPSPSPGAAGGRDLEPWLSRASGPRAEGQASSSLDLLLDTWRDTGELGAFPPAPAAAPPRGQVDGFEVLGELGRGGMGLVLHAREVATGREVALKLILAQGAGERRLERFKREGEITASLRHAGIVQVHAVGTFAGLPYLVMELVRGARPLDVVVPDLPLPERVALVRDAAQALGFAHAQGVVHRDVKPLNLLVDGTGRVRVTDFGLALDLARPRLTQTGTSLGTAPYMAPEQLGGERELGPTVDVWALGVVLYEVVCGVHPFQDTTGLGAVLARIASSLVTRPRDRVPGLSPDLEAVILRCLEREPAGRYPQAQALADELERWLKGERLARRSRARVSRGAWLAGSSLVLLLGSGLWALRAPLPPPPPPAPSPVSARAPEPERPSPAQPAIGPASPAQPARPVRVGDSVPPGELPTTEAVARELAEAGDVASMLGLWELLRERRSLAERRDGLRWLERAAEAGSLDGMHFYAGALLAGTLVERDPAGAARWYERAHAAGSGRAGGKLARLLLRGDGIAPDVDRAWSLALESARRGSAEGFQALSELGRSEQGDAALRREAEAFLRSLAGEEGHPRRATAQAALEGRQVPGEGE